MAIGDPNTATGTGSVAVGANETANSGAGAGAVAIGSGNTATGQGSVALGNASQATGAGALAFGDTATASVAKGVALGTGATATNANDVALGAGSVTTAPNTGVTALYGGTAAGVATGASGVVSVGTSGNERQIQNVAAGRITATSTDAINGSQLYTVGAGVNALGASLATSLGAGSVYNSATGAISAPGYGVFGTTQTNVGSAITALQTGAPVQFSTNAGVATPLVPSQDVTLVGAAAGTVALHNLTAGALSVASKDAVNGSQLFTTNANVTTVTAQTTTLGNNTATDLGGGASYTAGGGLTAPSYGVFGTTQTSVGAAITALQNKAPLQYSTAGGSATPLVPSQDVTLVGAAAGTVALHNLTAGSAGTDAVNYGQLTASASAAGTQTTTLGHRGD